MSTIREITARTWGYLVATTVVTAVAGYVSYGHIRDVAIIGHQDPVLASLLPLSVDGMLLVATLAMAEDKAHRRHPRGWARLAFWMGATVSLAANVASTVVHYGVDLLAIAVAGWAPIALLVVVEILARPGKPAVAPAAARRSAAATKAAATRAANKAAAKPNRAPRKRKPAPVSAPVSPGTPAAPNAAVDAEFAAITAREEIGYP